MTHKKEVKWGLRASVTHALAESLAVRCDTDGKSKYISHQALAAALHFDPEEKWKGNI